MIDDPINHRDPAAWRDCIARLREQRAAMDPDEYDAQLASLNEGLRVALLPEPEPPAERRSIRDRLKQ